MTASSSSDPIPCLSAGELRRAGRAPATPFQVRGDGEAITVLRLLRVLPGKRLTGEAHWRGRHALAKLFVAEGAAGRHWTRERRGLDLLREAGLPVPEAMGAGRLDGGGYFLLTAFLRNSHTLAGGWTLDPDDARAVDILRQAFALLGRLHAAELIQNDLHLGNFLEHAGRLLLIDGDGVERASGREQARDNLALLLAQMPPACESRVDELLAAYASERMSHPRRDVLSKAVERARAGRLADFLGKTLRECSQFAVRHTARRFSSVVRAEDEVLAGLLAAPDAAIRQGRLLKDGNTCTVARVDVDGRTLVIKRYNLKNPLHALSRCWRPSRAWRAWLNGHRLGFFGVATPPPLALVEERLGPLRRHAFLITEFCPGENLLRHLLPDREPEPAEAAAIAALFDLLFRLRIAHGDAKAANFLWHAGRLVLIDLDSLVQHDGEAAFRRAWRRDRARFLRNWPPQSPLCRWLDAHLPEAR
jgi:tRNA A-37 threonylcarbamoyl transferase component Bud32